MALDHFVSQVHLKNFYAPDLGERMYAMRKTDLKRFTCDAYSQCRIEDGSTNNYLEEPRAIEEFLRDVEPRYNVAIANARRGRLEREDVFAISGFAAYVQSCSPGGMRIHAGPMQSTLEFTAAMLDDMGLLPPVPPELGADTLTDLLRSKSVVVNIDPKYPQSIGINTILKSTSMWGNSVWDLIINEDPDNPFFTSEYPIAIEGSSRPGIINRLVPLAPDLALRIWPDLRQRGRVDLDFAALRTRKVRSTRQDVLHINRSIVQSAESTVYFSRDLPWIPGFVEKNRAFRIGSESAQIPQGEQQMIISSLKIEKVEGQR